MSVSTFHYFMLKFRREDKTKIDIFNETSNFYYIKKRYFNRLSSTYRIYNILYGPFLKFSSKIILEILDNASAEIVYLPLNKN